MYGTVLDSGNLRFSGSWLMLIAPQIGFISCGHLHDIASSLNEVGYKQVSTNRYPIC